VLLALREVAERRSDPYERVHCELKKRLTQHATDISNASSAISKALLELSRLRAESAKEEIDRKIISSVKEGNLQEARQMLKVAVTISPEEKYKRFLKVIAPPEIVSIKKPETEGIEKAVALLKQRGAEFVNKWIVISNGQPVELANSYAELHKKYKGKDVIITRVV
jgi:FMN phosphatase YigB (HAD superfamily)